MLASGGDHVVDRVDGEAAIVIATPGAEPVADGGYAGAVLLDTWLSLGLPSMRAREEAVRRWLNACALVATRDAGAAGSSRSATRRARRCRRWSAGTRRALRPASWPTARRRD